MASETRLLTNTQAVASINKTKPTENCFYIVRFIIKSTVLSFPHFFLIHSEQLEINQAAQKAVGELDTVLEWLEGISLKTQP